jgi:hypothetical protein
MSLVITIYELGDRLEVTAVQDGRAFESTVPISGGDLAAAVSLAGGQLQKFASQHIAQPPARRPLEQLTTDH